jgi:hypothetical protein
VFRGVGFDRPLKRFYRQPGGQVLKKKLKRAKKNWFMFFSKIPSQSNFIDFTAIKNNVKDIF